MEQDFFFVKKLLYRKAKRRNLEYLFILIAMGTLTFLFSSYLELLPILLISAGVSGVGYGITILREFRRFLPFDDKKRILHSMIESIVLTSIILIIGLISFLEVFDSLLFHGYTSLGMFIFVFSNVWGENSFRKKYLTSISFEQLQTFFENTPSSLFQQFSIKKQVDNDD